MAEKTQKAITIHEIDPDATKQLIDYAYLGDILITEENVQASKGIVTLQSIFYIYIDTQHVIRQMQLANQFQNAWMRHILLNWVQHN